jgi:hypothetical protein
LVGTYAGWARKQMSYIKCESCGVEWTDHHWNTATCKTVHEQAAEIAKLKAEIERLKPSDDTVGEPIGWMVVGVGDDGSILCERNGKRKRWNLVDKLSTLC